MKVVLKRVALFAFLMTLFAAPSFATGTIDSTTQDLVESIKLTAIACLAFCTAIITASLGIRIYKKLGKRAIGSA